MNCGSCPTLLGTRTSLATGMAGLVFDHLFQGRMREGGVAAGIRGHGPPRLDRRSDLDGGAVLRRRSTPKGSENAEVCEVLHWSQRVIDLADGDPV